MNLSKIRLRTVAPLAFGAFVVVALVLWWLGQYELMLLLAIGVVAVLQLLVVFLLRRLARTMGTGRLFDALKRTERALADIESPPEHAERLLLLQEAGREALMAQHRQLMQQDAQSGAKARKEQDRRLQSALDGAEKAIQSGVRREASRVRQDLDQLIRRMSLAEVRQVEGALALYEDLQPDRSLPLTRPWAASPDLLHTVARLVLDRRPGTVLEIGSGVSTVILALALRRVGHGRIVSFEHDEHWLDITRDLVDAHGVADLVDLRLAPLMDTVLGDDPGDDTWQWYDQDMLPDGPIGLLLVDGPPGDVQPMSRYPAVPLVWDRLAPDAVVVMDDYGRQDERDVVERWIDEHPELSLRVEPDAKQTGVLTRIVDED